MFTDEASPCLEDLGEPDQIWLEDVHTDHVTKALELSLYLSPLYFASQRGRTTVDAWRE